MKNFPVDRSKTNQPSNVAISMYLGPEDNEMYLSAMLLSCSQTSIGSRVSSIGWFVKLYIPAQPIPHHPSRINHHLT